MSCSFPKSQVPKLILSTVTYVFIPGMSLTCLDEVRTWNPAPISRGLIQSTVGRMQSLQSVPLEARLPKKDAQPLSDIAPGGSYPQKKHATAKVKRCSSRPKEVRIKNMFETPIQTRFECLVYLGASECLLPPVACARQMMMWDRNQQSICQTSYGKQRPSL